MKSLIAMLALMLLVLPVLGAVRRLRRLPPGRSVRNGADEDCGDTSGR